ncbi:MAG: amidohydrolase family protein [Sphingobium sp.]
MAEPVPEETAIDPGRPIIDPHLHLWEIMPASGALQAPQRFLLHEAAAEIAASGHNITHSIFVDCHAMYRCEGEGAYRSLGETEFANGMAAMSASGHYGPVHIAHRIVGNVDLRLGNAVRPVLEAHVAAAGERFRGVRNSTAWSEAPLFGTPTNPAGRGILADPAFHAGARVLAAMGLSLDVWCLHTQLDELIALADAVPDLAIILDHMGTPESQGVWANRAEEARADWAGRIARLAERPNVLVKLGGLGMNIGRPVGMTAGRAASPDLATRWRPYVETCLQAFGPDRAMFESNFPPGRDSASYGATWNAFKIISGACTDAEKDMLFRGTAARTYHIEIEGV